MLRVDPGVDERHRPHLPGALGYGERRIKKSRQDPGVLAIGRGQCFGDWRQRRPHMNVETTGKRVNAVLRTSVGGGRKPLWK